MDTQEEIVSYNIQSEMCFIGAIFSDPTLIVSYDRLINSKYDFYDEATKFFYDMLSLMYKTFSRTFTESELSVFASQDETRLINYRRYKGYRTLSQWKSFSDVKNMRSYYTVLKKYSLIREYERKGYPIQRILNHPKFEMMTGEDIYRIIRTNADKIHTTISGIDSGAILTKGNENAVKRRAIKPDVGVPLPWELLSNQIRGCRLGKAVFNGFLSNEGKTRNMMDLIAYLALVQGKKTLLLSNEMDEDDLQDCLITTVVNNDMFRPLHGVELDKPEKEIVEGIYRDSQGEVIKRLEDENGDYIETEDEYLFRLERDSEEFRKIIAISQWIDQQKEGVLFFKDVGSDYSDTTLEFNFREYKMVHGVEYCFYDTMKGYGVDDWQTMKQTATKIKELMKELKMFCWAVFQLTDDSVFTDVFQLSSNNISNSKQIKHVADVLLLGKRIDKNDYQKYQYLEYNTWGDPIRRNLDVKKTYFALKIDKNRSGNKNILPLFEIDLDRNIWKEIGALIYRNAR